MDRYGTLQPGSARDASYRRRLRHARRDMAEIDSEGMLAESGEYYSTTFADKDGVRAYPPNPAGQH